VVQIATLRRRSGADAAWLTLIISAVLIALALGNTIMLVAALIAAPLSGWLLLHRQAPTPVASPPLSAPAAGVARVQRSVVMGDGTARQALVVPADAVNGYQTVLTING